MLEHGLGFALVERWSRSYRLTAEGSGYAIAQEIEAALPTSPLCAERRPFTAPGGAGQRAADVHLQFLAPRLLPLQAEQPGLRIELVGEARQISLSQANPTSRFGWFGRRRKGLWRGGWRSWHLGSTGRAITSPDAARTPGFSLATMTASITCRSSVG